MREMGVAVSYDEFKDRMFVSGLPGFGPMLSDGAMVRLRLQMDARFRMRVPKEFFHDVVEDTARQFSFHPVRDYLDELVWDQTPRIDTWLSAYGGADNSAYTRAVGSLLLVAAVRRIRSPGCKFDEMVVLESAQGKNKSTALSVLAVKDDWFTDDLPLTADARTFIERVGGYWIVEAGELTGMRKGDVEQLKALLSRRTDRARLAYGRITTDRPRDCVIVGTTNSEQYLRDSTGNRRFWPVAVKAFDLEALRRDRDQLWAEAAALEAEGASVRLDASLWADAAEEQEERAVDDPFYETLGSVFGEQTGKVRSESVWLALGVDAAHRTQDQQVRLGAAMRKLGFQRTKMRFGGRHPENCYVRGSKSERALPLEVRREGDRVWTARDGSTSTGCPF